jgi:hypothetical protein
MNRKLHNTVMALIASTSLFMLGLLTATPVLSPAPAGSATTTFDAGQSVVTQAADGSAVRAQASPRRPPRRARQHTVAMPFFSFAPRG